jgi:hypothetical protein
MKNLSSDTLRLAVGGAVDTWNGTDSLGADAEAAGDAVLDSAEVQGRNNQLGSGPVTPDVNDLAEQTGELAGPAL